MASAERRSLFFDISVKTKAQIKPEGGTMICLCIENCINGCHWLSNQHSRFSAWWRHQMEIFSALLARCEGSSSVTGEFPQRPVTRSFDVFFDLRLNKRLGKQSWRRWFETLSPSLRRHCDGMTTNSSDPSFWKCKSVGLWLARLYNRLLSIYQVLSNDNMVEL